ncbi:putative protein 39 [Haloarcula hispanica icosahedral virus 2]|uniref:RNA polymerase sigma factor 70 region 4 type 2 domain-containing protein n=1 Tax=Haloarcula hispanica icosahedral virus 2 TaxID=1154689 RepID=H9AZZ5_9VIRU|nr:putative protein 39 [Haloarcula hispanica icosahedral virus 2]AFD02320.1 putative protein 39 [Haloarcula hispanica icosahedral virus 2]
MRQLRVSPLQVRRRVGVLMNGEEHPEDRQQRERVGVAGDPVPDHEYGDVGDDTPPVDPMEQHEVGPTVRAAARRLSDAGLLSDRQAVAYVLREVERVERPLAAEKMGVAVSTLDNQLTDARNKVSAARQTLDLLDDHEADE